MGENHKYVELREKIIKGMKLAMDRLIAETKEKDGELVFADPNGNPIRVKARSIK